MKTKVFIDGSEGTTGLRINERFQKRDDIELLHISPELRKDPVERKRLIHESDITFLCLPDEAARESVALAEGENAVIIGRMAFLNCRRHIKQPSRRGSGSRCRDAMPPALSPSSIR